MRYTPATRCRQNPRTNRAAIPRGAGTEPDQEIA
jgi:hypothetical protein